MKSGTVECFGIGNRNALVDPIEVVSADNSQFVYEGGNFYNGVDDNTSYFGVTKDNTTGDIYRVKIPVSSSTVQVKVGANGSFSTAKAISGNIYVWNSGEVTDYYVIDGSNYYHYRSTNSTGSKYLTDAVEVTDDASVSGAKGTVKVGGSTVSDAILTFTGEQFTGSRTTDSNGAYDIAMPQGTYQVSVKLSGSDVAFNMGTITLNQESKQTYDFGLTTLTGTVTDTSETPNSLSNARISVEYDGTSYTAISGSDGSYTLVLPNGIASEGGTFSVTANHLMAASKTETVNYQAPNTICNFALTAASSAEINVYTEDDLIMLSEFADQLSSKTINLMNDITLTGRFQGIKPSDNNIDGMTFNGNGHTIENLTTPLFQRPGNSSILYRCTVTDLHLKGKIYDNEHSYVGALATIFNGHKNNGIINGCSFEGSINSTVNNACVGGLVGSSSDSVIKNSFVRLTEITANNAEYMGGIVGDAKADIYNSYAIIKSFGGTMKDGCEGNRGSIVGGNSEGGRSMWIYNCYAVVESKETSSVVHRMGLGGSTYQYNFSYGPSGVFGTDATDMSHATDLSLNLMTAAARSGTGDNEPLVDRLNANTSGSDKTWYNGTDGYPCFTIPTYTITFSGGTKGTGSQEAKSVTLGESVTLPDSVYKNSDYVQKGWATSENSTTKAYELGVSISPTANMTLYPYWEAKPVASCSAPTGLTATYGDTLSNIALPDGFTWNAPSTSVGNAGTHTFTATYTPMDETYSKNPNVKISVEVKKAPAIYDTLVNKVTNLTYNRAAQQLVTAGTTSHGTIVYSLTGNNDYTSTIPTATNVGDYTVYYKILGDANHEDSVVGSVTVSISKTNLEGAVITLGDALIYNGEEQTQNIASVTVGTITLGAGDYTITGNKGTNVGNYTLTVTGIGNFTGTATKGFPICKIPVTGTDQTLLVKTGSAKDITYDLSKLLPEGVTETTTYAVGTVTNNNSVLSQAPVTGDIADGKLTLHVASVDTKDLTATVKITFTNEKYEISEATLTIQTTDKLPVTISGVTCGNRSYNGTAYAYTGTPVWKTEENVTVIGDTTVAYYKVVDYSADVIAYLPLDAAPTDAGSYRAEFTITSDDYMGTVKYSFEITKAQITVAAKNRSIYVGDAVPDLTTPTAGTDYIVTGLCGTDALGGTAVMSYAQEPDNTKTGTYEILISGLTVPEGENYTITFTNGTLSITTKPASGGGSSSGGSSGGAAGGAADKPADSDNTTTITNKDGSTTTTTTETDANGNTVTTTTTVATDGSTTEKVQATDTNAAGKEVAVTTTTKTDADGNVTSVTEKSVIDNIAKDTTATVTVKTDGDGNVTSAKASITKTSDSSKVSLSGKVLGQITEAAGADTEVRVTMTVKDSEGNTKYKVQADTNEIVPGEKLYIYKLDTKTGKYTMVNAKEYKVSQAGTVIVNMTKKATYELVTAQESKAITKEILATVKPAKSSKSLSEDKKTTFKLSTKLDMDNVKSITYTTSKKSIATVSKKGTITAVNAGTATVTAVVTLKNGTKKTIKMTIKVK